MRKTICILLISMVMLMAMPTLEVSATIHEIDDTYGSADYDPQIFGNSNNDLVVIYHSDLATQNTRLYCKYSTNNGTTWSDRIILFSNSTQLDGIIDDNQGMMWEISGEVYNDTLYLSLMRNADGQIWFTKCDVSDITNVATYSNWKSANGTPPPSEGNGVDGQGYDIVFTAQADQSLAVINESRILINGMHKNDDENIYVAYWNGSAWSTGIAKAFSSDVKAVPRCRHNREKEWVMACKLDDPTDKYIVVLKCDSNNDPTNSDNWTGMDGLGDYDIVLDRSGDTYHGNFVWPNLIVDNNSYVHVLAVASWSDPGWAYQPLWYNVWNGSAWTENETEGSAGSRLTMGINNDRPRIASGVARALGLCVDSGGYVIGLVRNTDPSGMFSMYWNGTEWVNTSWTQEETTQYNVVSEGYMRGNSTVAKFTVMIATEQHYIPVTGFNSGVPWWENYTEGGNGGNGGNGNQSLNNITLTKDIWNFVGYPNSTEINVSSLYSDIPNCTTIIGKNLTSGYWYTYWPDVSLKEYWNISFGDGLYVLVSSDSTWQVYNYTLTTSIPKSVYAPVVFSNPTDKNASTIYSSITNITALIGKNSTGYWYTYAPIWGIHEDWAVTFGDGLFILASENTTWDHT